MKKTFKDIFYVIKLIFAIIYYMIENFYLECRFLIVKRKIKPGDLFVFTSPNLVPVPFMLISIKKENEIFYYSFMSKQTKTHFSENMFFTLLKSKHIKKINI